MNAAAGAPSFPELFNARCEELGLHTAPEIAQRIAKVQPAAGKVDLARSVRNWQAGRNLPRSDFFRIILKALEIDEATARAVWHPAYAEAKAQARAARSGGAEPSPSGAAGSGAPVQASSADPPKVHGTFPDGEDGPSEVPKSPVSEQSSRGRAPYLQRGALLILAALVIGAIAVALYPTDGSSGIACDAAAGAAWDPARNPGVPPVEFEAIQASAVGTCEDAVADHPSNGRYWFQLGRARDRDARWHGDKSAARVAFNRADALDHAAAALGLGMLHERGVTGPAGTRNADLRAAAAHYQRAASAGLAMGGYCHAIATLFGWADGNPDPRAAMPLAEAAVAAGSNRAVGLVADLRAGAVTTRHTGCAGEGRVGRAPETIPWNDGRTTTGSGGSARPPGRGEPRPSMLDTLDRSLAAIGLRPSCEAFWVERNQLFNLHGRCFHSRLGRAVFGNGDCRSDGIAIPQSDMDHALALRARETRAQCNVDPTRETLEVGTMRGPTTLGAGGYRFVGSELVGPGEADERGRPGRNATADDAAPSALDRLRTSLSTLRLRPSCGAFWIERNQLFNLHGRCFRTPLGRAVFDNGDCTPGETTVPQSDREYATELLQRERRAMCSIDTARKTITVETDGGTILVGEGGYRLPGTSPVAPTPAEGEAPPPAIDAASATTDR